MFGAVLFPLLGDVQATTSEVGREIVGREAELALLDAFLADGGSPGALVLTGGPGIGKTTLWEAGVDLARRRGLRVLSARASGAETRLSFAALIDLLEGVGPNELGGLPAPQVQALEVALLRAAPTGDPPPPSAISVGFLNALRAPLESLCWSRSTTCSGSMRLQPTWSHSPFVASRATRSRCCLPSGRGARPFWSGRTGQRGCSVSR